MRWLRSHVGQAMVLVPAVTALIRDAEGRILLMRRSDDGQWDLPGGAIDPGEAPAQALVREVWEETGLCVVPERIAGLFGGGTGFRSTYPNGDEVEYTDLVFLCRIAGGSLTSHDGEASDFRWVAPAEMPALPFRYPADFFTTLDAVPGARFEWKDEWLPTE